MTELRFRVWDTLVGEMSPPFVLFGEFTLLGGVHAWQSEYVTNGDSLGRLNDLQVMQFTGIRDRDGIEVFEGDILFEDYADNENEDFSRTVYEVFFQNGMFVAMEKGNLPEALSDIGRDFYVAGNIYQDINLLK